MKNLKRIFQSALLCFLIIVGGGSTMQAQDLKSSVDQLLSAKYPSDSPGIAALIAKDGKVIYKNSFGLANLELSVPMNPDNVFEIGSITKQFTAVSILMLQEEGKLSTDDPIKKFFPDYPEAGKNVTVHQLLNHTSGIKSYTSMPSFFSQARNDLTPLELIDVFKNEPMDFAPGEQWLYNNSAYIILGAIIEQVSGMSYEDYIEKKIFEPLGMDNSYYGSKTELIPNRAAGYTPTPTGWRNADFLSMTLPYAGGSLMSCTEDMLLWQEALNDEKLLPQSALQLAFTNTTLNDGSPTNYGYGWGINEINGSRSIEHGGGIFGYTTMGVYLPEEDVYVIALTNNNGNSPTDIAIQMAAMAIGKPYPQTPAISISDEDKEVWVGAYKFDDDVVRIITLENGKLYSQREGGEKLPLIAVGPNEFYFEGSFTKYSFSNTNGKREVLFEDRIVRSKGVETEVELPQERVAIDLPLSVLKNYEGTYELQPGFELKVYLEGDKLMTQATGQPAVEIFAGGDHNFFLKVVPAELDFDVDQNGKATGVTLNQGGQRMPAKKVN
ncbi:serine hydrolase [Gilvibacter sp.]|uniref:serine hydrolase n=1 Tax=Gilvibacter sp. TaxID=2729997 RepID=UPI003F4A7F18